MMRQLKRGTGCREHQLYNILNLVVRIDKNYVDMANMTISSLLIPADGRWTSVATYDVRAKAAAQAGRSRTA
jgi:hypothetical protein